MLRIHLLSSLQYVSAAAVRCCRAQCLFGRARQRKTLKLTDSLGFSCVAQCFLLVLSLLHIHMSLAEGFVLSGCKQWYLSLLVLCEDRGARLLMIGVKTKSLIYVGAP